MKRLIYSSRFITAFCAVVFIFMGLSAETLTISSPDGRTIVTVTDANHRAEYSVTFDGTTVIEPSTLGINTNICSLGSGNEHIQVHFERRIQQSYKLDRAKRSTIHYTANQSTVTFIDSDSRSFAVQFRVSDNNVAFRYTIPQQDHRRACTVLSEMTTFNFPSTTTTFLCPQAEPMTGWKRTKPSYEEEYVADAPINAQSLFKRGYTFPCLFHVHGGVHLASRYDLNSSYWVLVSETGVSSNYCASRLSDATPDGEFSICYPMPEENDGFGSTGAQISLPGYTPWRTITVGDNLKPIVETTIPFDLVSPLYEPSTDYKYGRGTWSWMLWDDASINEEDLHAFVDLSAAMGWEYCLIDNFWDVNLGKKKMEELISYARNKGIGIFLWYNSAGPWNDTTQSPLDVMHNSITRKQEMRWLRDNGVKGIKVDFWGGDKQETMRLYEDVLSDANDYGLMVIFHGCTLPRGWERMYPNYVGSEAVLASENLKFSQHHDDKEAFNACLHPFIRNTVGCMEFGGTILNHNLSRDNVHGTHRITGDAFELATAILFQNPIQNFALTPNNLEDAPADALAFMREVPTTWDDTQFIDGYPGKFIILARRHAEKWYVAAINAEGTPLTYNFDGSLLGLTPKTPAHAYIDDKKLSFSAKEIKSDKKGIYKLSVPTNGGTVLIIDASE